MGKNPTEAKKSGGNRVEAKVKNVLYMWYEKKSNGAFGLKKEFALTDMATMQKLQ